VKFKDESATLGVGALGTSVETIIATEDRELLASTSKEGIIVRMYG